LVAGQFLLCLLFAGALAYTLAIVDNGNRRLELEIEGGVPEQQLFIYSSQTRAWRRHKRWEKREWILAALPRFGESVRLTLLFTPVVAMLPAAWFSLVNNATRVEDLSVGCLTAVLALLVVRLFFAGCRHWVWVDPHHLELVRFPFREPLPAVGWWFFRNGARKGLLRRRALRAAGEEWRDDESPA
jgi:hypothetical protein